MSKTREFYDEFCSRRMTGYRVDKNLRIEKASRFVADNIHDGMSVADIGCGIGIIAEQVARQYPSSQIYGVDISEKNIEYARKTISRSNVQFIQGDICNEQERIKDMMPKLLDVVYMVDIIEHIPAEGRSSVFSTVYSFCSDDAVFLLTFPSPEYQRYLMAEKPSELQVIDNVIELPNILEEACIAGWNLTYFSYSDAWMENQYVYVKLQKKVSLKQVRVRSGFIDKTWSRVDRIIFRPIRKKKYLEKPFRD